MLNFNKFCGLMFYYALFYKQPWQVSREAAYFFPLNKYEAFPATPSEVKMIPSESLTHSSGETHSRLHTKLATKIGISYPPRPQPFYGHMYPRIQATFTPWEQKATTTESIQNSKQALINSGLYCRFLYAPIHLLKNLLLVYVSNGLEKWLK